jgi:hypothetical protein
VRIWRVLKCGEEWWIQFLLARGATLDAESFEGGFPEIE